MEAARVAVRVASYYGRRSSLDCTIVPSLCSLSCAGRGQSPSLYRQAEARRNKRRIVHLRNLRSPGMIGWCPPENPRFPSSLLN
jgi:hypothetical protein